MGKGFEERSDVGECKVPTQSKDTPSVTMPTNGVKNGDSVPPVVFGVGVVAYIDSYIQWMTSRPQKEEFDGTDAAAQTMS